MKRDINEYMKILEKQGIFHLVYTYKINKKTVKRKNKSGTINTFYSGYMPEEIVEYFDVQDNRIFFYRKGEEVRITSRRPTVEHQEIKIQKTGQFSIPRSFFNVEGKEQIVLKLDLSKVDDYKNGLGVLSMVLIWLFFL